ncbi:MAG: hydrogenase maturation protease [Armatimonadota bacterium]
MKTATSARLEQFLSRRPTLVGIGSRWHGDDAAGPAVIARVSGRVETRCVDAGDAPERHLGEAAGARGEAVLLLDAVDFGGRPGEMALFTADELSGKLATTHTSSLGLLMRYLGAQSGAEVLLLGIQPDSIAFGQPMSASVRESVAVISDLLEKRLALPSHVWSRRSQAERPQASTELSGEGVEDTPWR